MKSKLLEIKNDHEELPSPNKEEEYKKWLFYEFKNRIFQKDIPMYNFIKEHINNKYNPINREYAAKYLKKYIWIDSLNTIITTFKLRDTSDPNYNSIIYAFLYSVIESDGEKKNKVKHTYFCCGPSLLSRDGEYRQRLIKYNTIEIVIKKYNKLWNRLENYILRKLKDMPWNYDTEYFFPTIKIQKIEPIMIIDINSKRLQIKFLIASWFAELFNFVNKLPINHINKLYLKIMGFSDKNIFNKDKDFYHKLEQEFGKTEIFKLRHDLNVYSSYPELGSLKIGQKLIPLNISEVQNPFNIKYKPWREFLISEKIQDLIINGICKGFPYIGDYFYIKDIKKTIFDNYVQYLKLEHSEQAIYIARKLMEAQMATYFTMEQPIESKFIKNKKGVLSKNKSKLYTETGEKIKTLYKLESEKSNKQETGESLKEISMWLSDKFKRLYEKIDDPIEYSKRDLIMSEVAFGVISEFVGRSFFDFLLLNNRKTGSHFYISETGDVLNDYDIWAKYIFEYIYDLLSLNLHMGIIHGDLHLNNTTVHPMFYKDNLDIDLLQSEGKIPYMLYVLKPHHSSNESIVFGFPSKQYHSCIIDYSRSIIRPSMIHLYKDFNIKVAKDIKLVKNGPIQLLNKDDYVPFNKDQICRILLLIENLFPDMYEKYHDKLEILITNYIEQLFPLLTAIDIYRFTSEIIKFFNSDKHPEKKKIQNSKQFKLINDINHKSGTYLTDKLVNILDNPNLLENDEYKTYANWDILNEFFSEFIIMTTHENEWKQSEFYRSLINKRITIIDISFLHNKIIYSMDSYSQFPDFLKYTKIMDKDGKIKFWDPHHKDPSEFLRKKIEADKKKNLKVISLIAARHKEKFF